MSNSIQSNSAATITISDKDGNSIGFDIEKELLDILMKGISVDKLDHNKDKSISYDELYNGFLKDNLKLDPMGDFNMMLRGAYSHIFRGGNIPTEYLDLDENGSINFSDLAKGIRDYTDYNLIVEESL